ncbi:MAG: glycosyltransferase [Rhodanobacteraceae bacterium]|nr:glycosyltransferase [Rhodanobacteraceae bacterium]
MSNAPDTRGSEGLHPDHDDVREFRSRWALGDAPCIAFLGSWYRDKRREWIILIGEQIRRELPEARIVVVGGGDGLAILRAAALPWLVLTGPLHGRDKFVALPACRCLCVTGVAGLNVLDAMTMGLPVVLPRRTDHSPEAIYITTMSTVVGSMMIQQRLRLPASPSLQMPRWPRSSANRRGPPQPH